ncbi:hypothetical protein I5M32_12515 [Pedobacter sp. SD-b]|uniref:Uncharacterized protein n=1 Tax=Pedobacter segetis TaxID=2793069 RepID=A0ABS1BNK6_9SPHI|nr:hypothetical protein [Pedobacter segetis]MBK0383784.1 hypothetical protein [Pedobacter segetis]
MDLSILKNKNSLIVSILLSLISFFLPWIGFTFINLSGFDILTMNNKINGVYDATSIYILLELVLLIGALFSIKKIIQKILAVLAFLFLLLTFYYITDTPICYHKSWYYHHTSWKYHLIDYRFSKKFIK